MKKIGKILKKYLFLIIIVISLVATQAFCELSLPSYTSDIVNVGIVDGGIKNATLDYVRVEEYNKLLLFITNKEDLELINDSYTLENKKDLAKEHYKLNNVDEDTKERIANILEPIEAIVYSIENNMVDIKTLGFSSQEKLFNSLDLLSYDQKEKLLNNMPIEKTIRESLSVNYVKNEYASLGIDTNNLQIKYITNTGLKMLGIALIAAIVTIISSFLATKVAAFFARDLRKEVTKQVMSYSHKEMEEIKTASLITRTTNDVTQVQNLLMMALRMLIFAPIMGIGAIIKVRGSSLSWIIIMIVLIIISLVIIIFSFVTPKFKIVQKYIDKLNLVSREFITGIPVIRAFSNEEYQENKFNKINKDITKLSLFLNKVTSVMMPLMNLIMNVACILILWFGAKKIDLGTLEVGDLIALITYSMHIIMSFLILSMFTIILPRAIVSLKRIGEILDKESVIKNKENLKHFNKNAKGIVEFKNVSFRYADALEDTLHNISFKADAGSTIAFIGSTGSGKSTLINLIPRFSDATEGEILIDGVNIKDVDLKLLRDKIGYVPQKGMLFTGDIASNVTLGVKHATQEDIDLALKISCATEIVKEKKEGLHSPIAQGGTNVSGGQRQRLAIARAVIKKPEIFIFDDSFSALDYKTDSKVRKLLNKYTKGSTKLIVAQRISTIMNADKIIVLDEGKIVGMGTHQDLLNNCNIYREIANSQLKEVQ